VYLLCLFMPVDAQVEVKNNEGILDMIIYTAQYNWVIEFKFEGQIQKARECAEQALVQIHQKKYYEPLRSEYPNRTILLVGLCVAGRQAKMAYEILK
ncbi:MAG: PD-(D/E)XK nuclease domain-containing protein, partial [Bacteroidia bacterium]|nr:PD-(D/E)XK nuclease domain-containing protein [Bacteroidia bacterium]